MANSAFLQRYLMPWSVVAVNTVGLTNQGYFTNAAGTITVSLPAASSVGDAIAVCNIQGDFQVTQGAGQQILLPGGLSTTAGAGGSVTSTLVADSIMLVCSVANTTWVAVPPVGGILTIV